MCGTCGRQLLSDCTCGTAAKQRNAISEMLSSGKTKDDVIAYYLAKYPGESALAMPIDKGFNRLAWMVPYTALLLGAGGLVLLGRRFTRKRASIVQTQGAMASSAGSQKRKDVDDHYEARLDDELDDLD